MIAILDACSFINILQTTDDERYFDWLEAEFSKIRVTDVVLAEIRQNMYVNLTELDTGTTESRDHLRQHIDGIVRTRTGRYLNSDDTSECEEVVQKATRYQKKNGEFFSVALALYLSRMGGSNPNDHLLSVFLVTDDDRARNDFSEFFLINQIGQLIDSIDIATFFYLRGRISLLDLSKFCLSLKALYSRSLAQIRRKIEAMRSQEQTASGQSLLSEVLELVMSGNRTEFERISHSSSYNSVKRKHKKEFEEIEVYMKAEEGRIAQIEHRRSRMEHLWQI